MHRTALILCASLLASTALAADAPVRPAESQRILDEMRIGVMLHDPWSPERGSGDIALQIYFTRPLFVAEAPALLVPRPFLGATINAGGKTSHVHAGLAWRLDLTDRLFVEAGFAGAVHNGHFDPRPSGKRNAMGCALHFRESVGIGFRLDRNWSVMTTIEHLSNGGVCNHNRGLTNLGVQVGYRF